MKKDKELVTLYKQGKSIYEIAKKYGVSGNTIAIEIRKKLDDERLEYNNLSKRNNPDKAIENKIIGMEKSGVCRTVISEKLNLSYNLVLKILRKNGFPDTKQRPLLKVSTKILDYLKAGLSYKEISEITGKTENSIRLLKSRHKLKDMK